MPRTFKNIGDANKKLILKLYEGGIKDIETISQLADIDYITINYVINKYLTSGIRIQSKLNTYKEPKIPEYKRNKINTLYKKGISKRQIAIKLGISRKAVDLEIKRNLNKEKEL